VLLAGGAPGELHVFDSSTGSKLATLTSGKVCNGRALHPSLLR